MYKQEQIFSETHGTISKGLTWVILFQRRGQKKKKCLKKIAAEDFSDMVTHIKLQNPKLIKSKER